MDKNIKARILLPKDKEQFIKLLNNYVEEYITEVERTYPAHFDPHIGEVYWKKIIETKDKYLVIVAESGNVLSGFCMGEIHNYDEIERTYFEGTKRGEVWDLFVDSSFRNQGIGKLMLNMMESIFKEKGCLGVVLNDVGIENDKAKKMYEKIEYKPWSVRYFKRLD